jgi:hypothetical protein
LVKIDIVGQARPAGGGGSDILKVIIAGVWG